jgi:glycosyltransferase involved in cell wall biosynthesis
VNEAVALSVPVVVSENVRAREVLIKQFVNGLIVEPTNLIGWVEALKMITKNEELYRNLSSPNEDIKKFADIIAYKEATEILIGHNPSKS